MKALGRNGLIFGGLLAFCLIGTAAAEPSIAIANAWSRATPGGAGTGAAFFVIENRGANDDTLLGADAEVADSVELHTHIHDSGVMRMRAIERILVPAGGQATLRPGGDHVMLIGLRAPLVEGQTYTLGLTFALAGHVVVPVTVKGIGAR
jgi:periplasmic copper chaperone A